MKSLATLMVICCAAAVGAVMPRGNCTSRLWPTPWLHIQCPPGRVIRMDSVTKVTLRSQTGCFFGPMTCINTEKQLRDICHWRPSCEWSSDDISSACPVRANYACIVGTTFTEVSTEEPEDSTESSGVEAPEVKTHAPTTTTSHKPHSEEVPIVDVDHELDSDEEVDNKKEEEEEEDDEEKEATTIELGELIPSPGRASSGNAYVILGLVLLALVILLVPLIIIVSRLRKKRQAAADYQAIGADEKPADNAAVENGVVDGENTEKTDDDDEKKPLDDDDEIEKAKLTEENEAEIKGEEDTGDTKPITAGDS